MQFNYNQGFIYSTNSYVGDYGSYSSYVLKPCVIDVDGGVYSSLYGNWLGGGYVAEGIIALVDLGAYSSYGISCGGFAVGAFSGSSYAGWWAKFGHIVLVDPAVINNTAEATTAVRNLTLSSACNMNNLTASTPKQLKGVTPEKKVPAQENKSSRRKAVVNLK